MQTTQITTQILQEAQNLAREHVAPHAETNDRDARFPKEGLDALAEAGLLGLTVPEEFGGMGQGARVAAGVVSGIAQSDASLGMVYMMHLAGTACIRAAPDDTKVQGILREIAAGRHLTTLAFSEKGSRSHFWAPVSRVANGDGMRVSAHKSFVTSARHADSYVVTTQKQDAQDPTQTTLYLVDRDSEGVQVEDRFDGLGLRANDSAPVRLTDVDLPPGRRISAEGGGFDVKINTVLPVFNLGSASVSLGISRAAVDAATNHLREARFEHLDQSIAEAAPNLRMSLARMQTQTDALHALVQETARSIDEPDEATMLRVMQVKLFGAQTATEVTRLGMQACGGAAFAKHNTMERHFRDAQAAAVMAPTSDVLEDLIGKALLGLPLF